MSAAELDPRVRAVLDGTDPYGHPAQVPDEVAEVMIAAVAELGEELSPPPTGVGLVLGAGVLDRLRIARTDGEPSASTTTTSRLDRRC